MWNIAPGWILLIWCSGAVIASYDGLADYWYSNDDGIIDYKPLSLYRSNGNINKTRMLRIEETSRVKKPGNFTWSFNYEKVRKPKMYGHQILRSTKNKIMTNLQNQVTPAETWRCLLGPDIILGDSCNNYCVCLGGQLYICSALKCSISGENGLEQTSYREKNVATCIEGQKIKSFNCNRCWCSNGKIFCTVKMCRKPKVESDQYKWGLADGIHDACIPGEYVQSRDNYCNTCACNVYGEQFCSAMTCGTIPHPKTDKNIGCVPMTWYSLTSVTATCKECFCINGLKAICFMKLCQGTLSQNKGYSPQKLMASASNRGFCTEGEIKSDKCTSCTCTYAREWKCYTRMIDKCEGQATQQLKAKEDKFNRLKSAFDSDEYEYEYDGKDVPEIDADVNNNTSPHSKNHTSNVPSHDFTSSMQETLATERPTRTTRKRRVPIKPTKAPRVNLLPGTECNAGESFTLAVNNNCQGCICSAHGKWKCFSVKHPCRGWETKSCSAGAFEKNKQIPCSVCYCGKEKKWMCFTDEACSQQIKQTKCDAIDCSHSCVLNNNNYGFCHRDKCICV